MTMSDCIDGPDGCSGDVSEYLTLSGSGMTFPRCEAHYISYVARIRPVMDDIARRYPRLAPADFDPLYAGERWDEDDE
jgi:hypothetical protein